MRRYLLGGATIALLTAVTLVAAVRLELVHIRDVIDPHRPPIPGLGNDVLNHVPAGGPQTLLLLGSDRRFVDVKRDNPVRSDTMMLVRLDPDKSATAVMSIPRDLKVRIPGHGTDKINAAYAEGGPALAVRTVKALLHIPVNHVVNVNFGGFRRAVDRLGCVYTDVDRRYYHSNQGLPPSQQYAEIDIPAGYQKLCGQKALDYVRYRHEDSDFVRSARQQDFLRQAKGQIGLSRLFSDRDALLRIFGAYTDTDVRSPDAILKLLKLTAQSAGHPVRQVGFRGDAGPTYVTITPANLRRSVRDFLDPQPPARVKRAAPAHRRRTPAPRGLPPGMVADRRAAEDLVARTSEHLDFPVYFAAARLSRGFYPKDSAPRAYDISDVGGHRHRAYRMVVATGLDGQYYGIEGTDWRAPPILDDPSAKVRLGGRTFELHYDGARLRVVAWRTPRAVYWVSNSLSETVTNRQMLALARSLTRVGG